MIATLKKRDGRYYCSNCRMVTPLRLQCHFCGAEFTNYTTTLLEAYNTVLDDEIKENKNEADL